MIHILKVQFLQPFTLVCKFHSIQHCLRFRDPGFEKRFRRRNRFASLVGGARVLLRLAGVVVAVRLVRLREFVLAGITTVPVSIFAWMAASRSLTYRAIVNIPAGRTILFAIVFHPSSADDATPAMASHRCCDAEQVSAAQTPLTPKPSGVRR